jgi:hypothetical protein
MGSVMLGSNWHDVDGTRGIHKNAGRSRGPPAPEGYTTSRKEGIRVGIGQDGMNCQCVRAR